MHVLVYECLHVAYAVVKISVAKNEDEAGFKAGDFKFKLER